MRLSLAKTLLEVCVEPVTRVRSFVLLGMLLLGTAACADNTVAPNGKTPQLRRDAVRAGARRPTLFANTTKYRDKGLKHAHGRAAIATTAATAVSLDARGLLGRDGITTLDVSTGSIDDGTTGVGVLSKLQLKLYTLNGSLQTTNNYNGLNTPSYQVRLADRARGSNIQVQGSITTGGKHTDVITVTETVTTGKSTSGIWLTPSRRKQMPPKMMRAAMSIHAKTGFRMERSERVTARLRIRRRRREGPHCRRRRRCPPLSAGCRGPRASRPRGTRRRA